MIQYYSTAHWVTYFVTRTHQFCPHTRVTYSGIRTHQSCPHTRVTPDMTWVGYGIRDESKMPILYLEAN